jgi:hypothetical protein
LLLYFWICEFFICLPEILLILLIVVSSDLVYGFEIPICGWLIAALFVGKTGLYLLALSDQCTNDGLFGGFVRSLCHEGY